MRSFIFSFLVLVTGACALCSGSAWAVQAPPNARYQADLAIGPAPIVGRECILTLTIRGFIESPHTQVLIDIPDGVEVLNGAVNFTRNIAQDDTYVHEIAVRVTEEGKYNFLAIVKSQVYRVNYSEGALAELHVVSTDSSASVYEQVDQSFYQTEELDTLDGAILKRITPDYEYPFEEFDKSTTITISGTIKYKNKETGAYDPFPHAKVRVNNYVTICCDCSYWPSFPCCGCHMPFWLCIIEIGLPCGSPYPDPFTFIPRVEVVYTDSEGNYSVPGWPAGENVRVSVLMDNDVAYIGNDDDGAFPEVEARNWPGSDLVLNLNIDYSEPARILHNLYKACNWCTDKLGWNRNQIRVDYHHGGNGGAYFSENDYMALYQYWGSSDEIWWNRGRTVAAHEYGHGVMFTAFGGHLPDGEGPSPHYINSVSSPRFAFCEGWAEFFAQAVYTTEAVNEFGYDYQRLEHLDEQASYYGCPYWQGRDCDNANGEIVEGAVATFLWDLYDSPATMDASPGEDDDDAIGLYSPMWNVLLNGILVNVQGQQFHAQFIYQFLCLWNDEDPASNVWIFEHAPGPQPVDAIYLWDLFGVSPLPDPPTDLDATAVSCEQINLTWTDNSDDESGFRIEQKLESGGTWTQTATVDSDVISYSATGLAENTSYCFRVRAYNAFGDSEFSNIDCAATPSQLPGCPFVYVWTGKTFEEDNTILAACEMKDQQPEQVTDHYLLRKPLAPKDDLYRLQIREFEQEKSYLDNLELLAVDHTPQTKIGVTPDGLIFTYERGIPPLSCVDHDGQDQLMKIIEQDDEYYTCRGPGHLILTYGSFGGELPPDVQLAPGPPPPAGKKVVSGLPGASLGGYLEICDSEGNWIGLLDLPPRANADLTFTVLNEKYLDSEGNLKLRLSWQDHYSADEIRLFALSLDEPEILPCPLVAAVHSVQGGVSQFLLQEDHDYATLIPGENIELQFLMPGSSGGHNVRRDFVLKSKGYYVRLTREAAEEGETPQEFTVLANYPNPFNPTTLIGYTLATDSRVKLTVFNLLGQEVRTLVDEYQHSGPKSVWWDGKDENGNQVSSGIYLYQIRVGESTQTKKMVLVR